MMKISSSDVIAILRRFELATDEHMPRHIEQVKYSHPSPHNTLVSFRFFRQQYYILFDSTAEDDTAYIEEQIRTDKFDVKGELIENPQASLATFALPFKGKEVYVFRVVSDKKRLDALLPERYPEFSRSTWQKYIKAGYVTINSEIVASPKADVTEADSIAVQLPPKSDYSSHELPIVYIDDDVIVVNKPVGTLTHSKGALNEEFTVADFFRRYTTFGLDTNRPGIVHRLDRDTSGIIIGARNPEAGRSLQKQFADRKVKKTYVAILDGHPKEREADIDLPIGRHPAAPSTFRVDPKGKSAVTRYIVIAQSNTQSLVRLHPATGRTHQLRVHMNYIGSPIAGDRIYGKPSDRLYLHAHKLEVTIPGSERRIFEAPIPDEFMSLFPGAL